MRAAADLPPPPPLPRRPWAEAPPWLPAWQQGAQNARVLRRALRRDLARGDRTRRALVLAVKAGVIAADSAASGLVRTGRDISHWIEEVAHKPALTPDKLSGDIIAPRCQALAAKADRPFTFHAFQDRAARLGPRALLIAGCGSGKTLAAWRWAQAQLGAAALGHVVFLYPTRGTATEGFRDYVGWAPEDESMLLHATSAYELAGMRENPADEPQSLRGKRAGRTEAELRLYALGLWPRRYFSATVDQFLAFLEHRYESLCLLPLLADSAVILDEVHSYDRAMFKNLVAFLGAFRGPVLCMTATLPPGRRRALEDLGLRVYPGAADRVQLADLEAAEDHPRYCIERIPGAAEVPGGAEVAEDRAVAAYRAGKRVLWVVNTVNRCQVLARRLARVLADELAAPVLAYHSRYCLADRRDIHRATVDAFQTPGVAAIAVTTQVCEMSLDLDADVLITEEAPISALVQRMGRANRHARPGDPGRAAVCIYPPPSHAPYSKEELAAIGPFLDDIGAGDTSQRALAEALERHSPEERQPDGSARFLEAGYYAVPGSFREPDAFSVRCVLDTDVAAIEPYKGDRRAFHAHLLGFEISVPRRHALDTDPPAWLPRYLRLAPGDRYDPALGFLTGDSR